MIIVRHFEGRYAPIMVCDICHKRIEDAGLAVVVTPRAKEPEELLFPVFAHKGNCHSEAEKRAVGGDSGWDELTTHLLHLVQNLGLTPQELLEHEQRRSDSGADMLP